MEHVNAETQKYIYVMLSQTNTRVGAVLRKLGNCCYNHASISLDDEFTQVYSYARSVHRSVFSARLVKENLMRLTLEKGMPVPVEIFKIPVTQEQHQWIEDTIRLMYNNPDYIYNLYSLVTHPFLKGFTVNKAYTCIEFVVYILQHLGICTDRPCCKYTPDDLIPSLDEYEHHVGDASNWMPNTPEDTGYFGAMTPKIFYGCARNVAVITKRTASMGMRRGFRRIRSWMQIVK